jgi:hypothetical protein
MEDPSTPTAESGTLTISCRLPDSIATIAVIILVKLAIRIFSSAFFS